MKLLKKAILILPILLLTSCAPYEEQQKDIKESHTAGRIINDNVDFKKHATGEFKVGSSYKKKGNVYAPKIDIDYDEEGFASWYGPRFHGKKTANGTKYNQNEYTAAHPTLPLPSVVKVTNLENNRTIKLVVNDRGPFHNSKKRPRIIDVSKKAATELGIMNKGIAKVRVEYLHEDTKKLLSKYPQKEKTKAVAAYTKALTKSYAAN